MASGALVLFEEGAAVGVITLNRPKALNSLNKQMVELLQRKYTEWNSDEAVHAIVIRGAGGKAFCAGGDVKTVVQGVLEGRAEEEKSFFSREYALNLALSRLSKPHVALIDGICMGGGAGISMHGPFRIATERTLFAMPECGIGLFPDVGASHFLNRLPGCLGTWLGLTGARLRGYQTVEAGLATHLVASSLLEELLRELQALGRAARDHARLNALFTAFQARSREHTQATGLLDTLPDVNACFSYDSVEAVVAALERRDTPWAREALKLLAAGSPLSQKITLRELREGAGRSLAACLAVENRLAQRLTERGADFAEGVRALLIDRDNQPRWRYPSLEQVTEDVVDQFFRPLPPGGELPLEEASQAAEQSKL